MALVLTTAASVKETTAVSLSLSLFRPLTPVPKIIRHRVRSPLVHQPQTDTEEDTIMSHSLRVKGRGAGTAQANAKSKGHRRLPTKFVELNYLGKRMYSLLSHVHEVKH